MQKNRKLYSHEIGDLYFGQLHHLHLPFFDKRNHQHARLKLRDMPHYEVLREGTIDDNKNIYLKYLKQSWKFYFPEQDTREKRKNKIKTYKELLEDIRANGISTPAEIMRTPDGNKMIIQGNHRSSIAYHLNLDLPVTYTHFDEYVSGVVNRLEMQKEKDNRGIYPSFFYGKKELYRGQRSDILKRFLRISISDIRGKSFLDMENALGANADLAWFYGAKMATAVECSALRASSALRISTALNSEIKLIIQQPNLIINKAKKHDTVLCSPHLSTLDSEEMMENIKKNILNSVGETLYFEGQKDADIDTYRHIFSHFNRVELVGYNLDNHIRRPFFRCERKQ